MGSSNMSRESLKRIRSGLLVLFGLLLLYVMLCIYTDDIDTERNTISQFGEVLGEVSGKVSGEVSRIDSWPHGIQLAQWREHFVPSNNLYNWEWDRIARGLRLHRGCNSVDIGAQIGDTSLNLAAVFPEGAVVAFEMGPPIQMLRLNVRLNPQFKIDVHNVAVSNKTGSVVYHSGSNGANGGIAQSTTRGDLMVESVRPSPFLHSQYSEEFLDNVCLLKIDTEGHDVVILDDLSPPVIWTEWFRDYQFLDFKEFILEDFDFCTAQSAELFRTILRRGYEIFQPSWPLTKG